MKVSEHFIIQNFVPKEIYERFGSNSVWFVDPKLISLCEYFMQRLGMTVTINDWSTGGQYNNSGYRTPDSATGAMYSQHKFGRAADLKFKGISNYSELPSLIKANWEDFKAAGLTTIEADTPTWLHVDIRHTGINDLLIVPFK